MRFCSDADSLAYKGRISVCFNSNFLNVSARSRISRSPVRKMSISPALSDESSSIALMIG